jgi:hypothetical protein
MNQSLMVQDALEKATVLLGRLTGGCSHKVKEVESAVKHGREYRSVTLDLEDGTTLIMMLWSPIAEVPETTVPGETI